MLKSVAEFINQWYLWHHFNRLVRTFLILRLLSFSIELHLHCQMIHGVNSLMFHYYFFIHLFNWFLFQLWYSFKGMRRLFNLMATMVHLTTILLAFIESESVSLHFLPSNSLSFLNTHHFFAFTLLLKIWHQFRVRQDF